ncbi:invasion protein OrgB [Yersinia nurmii]|uniref:Invasion protein OrgB n=1 Tax=Yersinia nurmii TaxID=685706 RepID=A0ABP1YNH8_9GAMM|nr:hypothetical protein [Yersinia nurmii]CNF07929.1 invasion protein OrgB [Yersinia nurmii]
MLKVKKIPLNEISNEKVLIKRSYISSNAYHVRMIEYAKKEAKMRLSKTEVEVKNMTNQAHDFGFKSGIFLFIDTVISAISLYQEIYNQNTANIEVRLKNKLQEIFGDTRFIELVSEHFHGFSKSSPNIELHIPKKHYAKIIVNLKNKSYVFENNQENIIFKLGDEIIVFDPNKDRPDFLQEIFPSIKTHILNVNGIVNLKKIKEMIKSTPYDPSEENENNKQFE